MAPRVVSLGCHPKRFADRVKDDGCHETDQNAHDEDRGPGYVAVDNVPEIKVKVNVRAGPCCGCGDKPAPITTS